MGKHPNTEPFFWTSHIAKQQGHAHTSCFKSVCQILTAKLTFAPLEWRHKEISSRRFYPMPCCSDHKKNANISLLSPSTQSPGQWTRVGVPQTPQTHLCQIQLGCPCAAAALWRTLVPQETQRPLMLGKKKSQNQNRLWFPALQDVQKSFLGKSCF